MTEEVQPISNLGNGRFAFNCSYCGGEGSISRDRDNRAPYVTCRACKGRGISLPFLRSKGIAEQKLSADRKKPRLLKLGSKILKGSNSI